MTQSPDRVLKEILSTQKDDPDRVIGFYMKSFKAFLDNPPAPIAQQPKSLTFWFDILKAYIETISFTHVSADTLDATVIVFNMLPQFLEDVFIGPQCVDFVVKIIFVFSEFTSPTYWTETLYLYFVRNRETDSVFFAQFLEFCKNNINLVKADFWWIVWSVLNPMTDVAKLQQLAQILVEIENPGVLLNPSVPKTILWAFRVIQCYRGSETMSKMIRMFIIPAFDVRIEAVNNKKTLNSYKGKFIGKGRDYGLQILDCIQKGIDNKPSFINEFMMLFVSLLNSSLGNHWEMVEPDNEWMKAIIMMRKVFRLLYKLNASALKTITHAIDAIADLQTKIVLTITLSFDIHMCDFISHIAQYPNAQRYIDRHFERLGVVYAPLFLHMNHQNVETFSNNISVRNKRMKITGYEVDFLEHAVDIFTDAVEFEHFLNIGLTEKDAPAMRLNLSKTFLWTKEDACKYIEELMVLTGNNDHLFYNFISHLARISRRLVNYVPDLNHTFLMHEYLSKCFGERQSESLFKAALLIFKSASLIDTDKNQVKQWIDLIIRTLKNNDYLVISCEAAQFCMSHFVPDGFDVASHYLDNFQKLPDFQITDHLQTLASIYTFCLHTKTNEELKQRVISLLSGFVATGERNEDMFDVLTTILVEEVTNKSMTTVSEGVASLWRSFLSKKETNPPFPLRMLTMFPQHFELFDTKFPGFFTMITECITEILCNKESSDLLFLICMETLVDILLRIDNGSEKFMEIKGKVSEVFTEGEKHLFIDQACEEFISRFNHSIREMEMESPADVYAVSHMNALHKIVYEQNSIKVATKSKTGSWIHRIEAGHIEQELVPSEESAELCDTELPESPENDFLTTFKSVMKESTDAGIINPCRPSDFAFPESAKDTSARLDSGVYPLTGEGTPTIGKTDQSDTVLAGSQFLYPSYHATAVFDSVFGEKETASMYINKPFSLLDIASNNLFSLSVREGCKIGLLYVKRGQSDQNVILQNGFDMVSDTFKSFLNSVGTIVDLSTHTGFTGRLDTKANYSNGRYQLYVVNDRFEVLYHVAPLLPTDPNDDQQIYKKRHIGNDNVHVVWSEHDFDYEASTITSQFNDAHIIVYPLRETDQFYRVVVYRKVPTYELGPLRTETIVSVGALPILVNWTAIFSDRVAREATSVYRLPNQLFVSSISDLVKDKSEDK